MPCQMPSLLVNFLANVLRSCNYHWLSTSTSPTSFSSWWFQPTWKRFVKLDHFPRDRGKNKKYLKPALSFHINFGTKRFAFFFSNISWSKWIEVPTCTRWHWESWPTKMEVDIWNPSPWTRKTSFQCNNQLVFFCQNLLLLESETLNMFLYNTIDTIIYIYTYYINICDIPFQYMQCICT